MCKLHIFKIATYLLYKRTESTVSLFYECIFTDLHDNDCLAKCMKKQECKVNVQDTATYMLYDVA